MCGYFRLPRALVRSTEAHNRPAVVPAGPNDVDLIAAIRSVLVFPDLSGSGMDCQSERRAMTERVDLWLVALAPDERIVVRNASVIAKSQQFAAIVLGILWCVAAIGHEQGAIPAECDSRRTITRLRDKDIPHVYERFAVPASACDGVGRPVAFQRLRIREIHEMIFSKTWVQREVHQSVNSAGIAGFARISRSRHACHRLRVENAVANNAELSGSLADEHLTAREKCQTPRIGQTLRDDNYTNSLALAGIKLHWQWR